MEVITLGDPAGDQLDDGDDETVHLATPGFRIGARIVDTILQLGPLVAWVVWALATFDLFSSGSPGPARITLGLALIWFVGYEFVQVAAWGQTIGKRMTGIKVVRSVDGGGPGWGKALGRWAVLYSPFIVFCLFALSYAWIGLLGVLLCGASFLWGRKKQGWHDIAAGTVVVRA